MLFRSREYGAKAFETAIQEALSLSTFFIRTVGEGHDWSTPEGRAQSQHAAKPLLQMMPAIALRAQMIRELAQKTGVSSTEIEAFCGIKNVSVNQSQPSVGREAKADKRPKSVASVVTDLAEQVLKLLLQFPRSEEHTSELQSLTNRMPSSA